MKLCPSCNTQYTDESLAYCLQDGARLVPVESVSTGSREAETVVRSREPGREETDRSPATRIARSGDRAGSKATIVIALLLVTLVGVVIILVLGLAWLLWRPAPVANANDRDIKLPVNINSPPTSPTPSPSPTSSVRIAFPTPAPPSPPTNTGDDTSISQVGETIERWREATNAMDSVSLIENYAGTVDYYRRGPVNADFVLNDKKRAFDRFTTITITISNMSIAVDPSGDRATAEFDKAWVFRGARAVTGKARSQLRFARVAGKWLITAEQDLKVYYTGK